MTWPETKFTRLYPPYKKPDRRARFIPYPPSLSLSSILSSFNFFDNLERAFFFFSSLVKNITRLIACISRLSVPGKHSAIFFTYRIASFQIASNSYGSIQKLPNLAFNKVFPIKSQSPRWPRRFNRKSTCSAKCGYPEDFTTAFAKAAGAHSHDKVKYIKLIGMQSALGPA